MTAQPPPEPEPAGPGSSAAAEQPVYGSAPDPTGAYPRPDEGGFAPLPDLVPDERAAPGPGYGTSEDEPVVPATEAGLLRRLWSRLTRR